VGDARSLPTPNVYSAQWFARFLEPLPTEYTDLDISAIQARLPVGDFSRILDLCCGPGRHAARLAALGYCVTGIDRDQNAISLAQRRSPTATFHCLDVRAIGQLRGQLDGVLLLWQSFGYFSRAENDRLLRDIWGRLRPGGRFLIDVFHADYFRRHQGPRSKLPNGVSWLEDRVVGDRLHSRIRYDDGAEESMDFEIFTPEQLAERATSAGFRLVESCCWWDQRRPPDSGQPRFQLTLERDAK
jgi:SAM-dependent methyltransferase